jgi:UDP-glucose 4-epimerase
MKNILITGAAGFIGSNLAIRLVHDGHNVIAFDNLSQGNLRNLDSIKDQITFYNYDVMNDLSVVKEKIDVIYHLAAFKIPRYTDALDTLRINAFGTDNVAQLAVRKNAHLIAASTSDVYGKNNSLPFSEETDSVIGPPDVKRWAYAISKMFDEQLLFAYKERHGLDVTLVRFFGGYGPHQHLSWWGGPQSVFINAALLKKPIEIHGDGMQTRTFTYISDHVDGLVKMHESKMALNQLFNLGSFSEISIVDLAHKIWHMVTGSKDTNIHFIPYESFGKYEDVRRRVPDISKAQELLGYQPRVSLEEGLKTTIDWQKNL